MTLLDIGILVILLYNGLQGLARGFAKIVSHLFALVGGIFFGVLYYADLAHTLETQLKIPSPLSEYSAFLLIFGGLFLLMSLIGLAVEKILKTVFLGSVNHLAGFAIGLLKGIFILLPFLVPLFYFGSPIAESSLLIKPFKPLLGFILNYISIDLLESTFSP